MPPAPLRPAPPRGTSWAYAPAALWAAALLAVGGWSGAPGPPAGLGLDKVAHLGLYGVLGVLTARGWWRAGARRRGLVPLVLALLVGPADELHQRGVAQRTAEWGDLAADTAGVLAGFALVVRRRRAGNTMTTEGSSGTLPMEHT